MALDHMGDGMENWPLRTDAAARREDRLMRRIERERQARKQAEALLEDRSARLYEAKTRLEQLNLELEQRVHERTYELQMAQREALALAQRDQLTGLANRRSFLMQLDDTLHSIRGTDEAVAIMALDLDHFKDINDTLGHQAGDALLKVVAKRLISIVRSTDVVARLGGDEFAILSPLHNGMDDLSDLANRVVKALEEPVSHDGHLMEVSCSIGVAVAPHNASCPTDLQRFADIALYCTKDRGRGDWTLYEESMIEGVRQRRKMAHRLREALNSNQLEVWYQPVVELNSGKVVAAEALCRWHDPDFGPISPDVFIPIAEESPLIHTLGDFVLRRSIRDMKGWLEAGQRRLSVNLSPRQLKDRQLLSRIETILDEEGLASHHLCLEVTESLFLWDIETAKERLNALSARGITIALDDFGTGFSNLSQLRFLPIDYLKIDRSFIGDIETDPRALTMVGAIGTIAEGMSIRALAEGVETVEQARLLKQVGINLAQGYCIARPMTCEAFKDFVAQNPCLDYLRLAPSRVVEAPLGMTG